MHEARYRQTLLGLDRITRRKRHGMEVWCSCGQFRDRSNESGVTARRRVEAAFAEHLAGATPAMDAPTQAEVDDFEEMTRAARRYLRSLPAAARPEWFRQNETDGKVGPLDVIEKKVAELLAETDNDHHKRGLQQGLDIVREVLG